MVRSRFVVLKMKDIIRMGIFVLLGIALLIALLFAIMPSSPNVQEVTSRFAPGTYTAYIILHNQPVAVAVTVCDEQILDIALSDFGGSLEVFFPLIPPTMAS